MLISANFFFKEDKDIENGCSLMDIRNSKVLNLLKQPIFLIFLLNNFLFMFGAFTVFVFALVKDLIIDSFKKYFELI